MRLDGRLTAASTAIMALLSASPGRVESSAGQDLPIFGTAVRLVAVPVFVTDPDGGAVSGLTASDFAVEDEGIDVSVVALQEVDAHGPADRSGDAGPLLQAASRRQFLLLFDLTFSKPVGITKARDAAIEFVRRSLEPTDLAAAATFGPSGVRLLVGFTSDRDQLARAIGDLGLTESERRRDPLSLAWDVGLDLQTVGPSRGGPSPIDEHVLDQLGLLGRVDSSMYLRRVMSFLDGLERLGRMLDGVQGRKQVILFSGGFDSTVLMGAQGTDQLETSRAVTEGRLWEVQSDEHFGDASARGQLEDLYDALAATDAVFHTVDVGGLATDVALERGRTRIVGGREMLAQLALNTGGRFVKDANDLGRGLEEVLDATRHYYILAFEPREPGRDGGRLRRLRIAVPNRDVRVSHRAGYVLPDPEEPQDTLTRQLQAAETIAKGLSGGTIGLRAVAVPYRSPRNQTLLPVVLEIDGASLVRDSRADQLALEVFGYALDDQGRIHDVMAARPSVDLRRSGASLRRRGLQVLTTFAVPDGLIDLRFLVRETNEGRAGSLRVEVGVPSFEGETLTLSPPLFMDDPRARVVLPVASRGLPSLEIPFRLEDTPFTVDARPALSRRGEQEVCVMAWSGRRYATSSPYELTAELLGADEPAPARLEARSHIVNDADGFQRFVMALGPATVPPGDYTLRLRFRDPATGRVESTEARVAVQ